MGDLTLGEFLAQAQRGMGGGYFGRVSGPLPGYVFGPDFFRKAGESYLEIADTFRFTYGKKVWDSLNNRTVTFNAIKKVDWGPTVGWRLRSARITSTQPVSESGSLPTIGKSTYQGVYSYPKNIVSTFGVTLKGQAVSALEGGIGNQFAVEQEAASRDHVKEINSELMAGSAYLCATGAADTATIGGAAAAYALAGHFKIGDTVSTSGASDAAKTITTVVTSTGVITATGITGADGTAIYIKSRNGITSIDDICMDDSARPGGDAAGHTLVDAYNLTTRTAGTYAAGGSVSYNAGVGRDLTLSLVDAMFQTIRQNGGEPKLIITGLDQYDKLNQLLQAQQRFVDVTDYIVGAGDERTYPGTRAGFQLATYRGVPILPDPDTPKSLSTADVVLGSNMYCLDTDYLELAVMYPTQYIENRDYFAINSGERKLYYMLENPVNLAVPEMVKICPMGTISREDSRESPQRLYVEHSEVNDDIVRTEQRCSEVGRNVQPIPVCLNCRKLLVLKQMKFCSRFCQGKYKSNLPKTQRVWNKGLNKDLYPQLSNSGVKKGNIPWNKNKKGLQIAWNKNTKGISKGAPKGHACYLGSGNSKWGYREDLGHFVRSSWEANVCRIFVYLDIPYKYENKRFQLSKSSYCPDIELENGKVYWEIKGYQNSKWKEKLVEFRFLYSNIELKIIDKDEYRKMEEVFSNRIVNWER